MKILHVVRELEVGGIQILLNNLLQTKTFKQDNHFVLCIGEENAPVQSSLEEKGVKVFCIPKKIYRDRGLRPYRFWKIIRIALGKLAFLNIYFAIFKIIIQKNIDIVHTHYGLGLYGQVISASIAGAKVVYTIHGIYQYKRSDLIFLKLAIRFLGSKKFALTAVSNAALNNNLKKKLRKLPIKQYVIYNGIDLASFQQGSATRNTIRSEILGTDTDSILIGSIGRLVEDKGYEVLIEAIIQIKTSIRNVRFIIGGDGPLYNILENQVTINNLDEYVQFLGYVDNVPDYLHAFDIYVQPSIKEGQSTALIEAMAAGLPVVASNVGGIPEVVEHMKNGILVPPNDPVSLGFALLRLINDENIRKELSKHSIEIAGKFLIEDTARSYLHIYSQLNG